MERTRRIGVKFSTLGIIVCSLFSFCRPSHERLLRPRGISLEQMSLYVAGRDFTCLDGSISIPFNQVNDDYCDCADGSDEPGTSACSNGVFYCENTGYVPFTIPSNRINDNICDCCDGSDEYSSTASCTNLCFEMGRQAVEERKKQQELFELGYSLYEDYAKEGSEIKENNKIKLEEHKKSEAELDAIKSEKEALKNEIEEKEKVALDKYKSLKEEENKQQEEMEMLQHQEEEKKKAEAAFQMLDIDKDNVLTYQEIQQFDKFDSNVDGQVSEDEAKFFLHMKDSMDLEEFVSTGWMIMKPIYEMDQIVQPSEEVEEPEYREKVEPSTERPIPEEEPDDETYSPESESDAEEELLDDGEDEELRKPRTFEAKDLEKSVDKPEYDEETQQLVDAANEARKNYDDAVTQLERVKDDIRHLQSDVEGDFGLANEFLSLKGKCFDYEDREYTYRFCPFDKASQIAKSGGSDVNLGRWGSWAGPEGNTYSKMKYDNGQTCWNGPARSVMVLLECGLENKLLSSTEPNRCEYLFEFKTPALCSRKPEGGAAHQHTEL